MPVPSRPCPARTALYTGRSTQLRVGSSFVQKSKGMGADARTAKQRQATQQKAGLQAAGRAVWFSFQRKLRAFRSCERLERGARAPPTCRAGMRASHDRDAGMRRSSRARRGWQAENEGKRKGDPTGFVVVVLPWPSRPSAVFSLRELQFQTGGLMTGNSPLFTSLVASLVAT